MRSTDNTTGQGDAANSKLVFDERGRLILPVIQTVLPSEINTVTFGGIRVMPGQNLVTDESIQAADEALKYLAKESARKDEEIERLARELGAKDEDLKVSKLGAMGHVKWVIHPLVVTNKPEGVETIDPRADKAIILRFEGRTWFLACTIPELGKSLHFGGLARTGFYARLTLVAQDSALPGGPKELGYEFILASGSGTRHREHFISKGEFEDNLFNPEKPSYVIGSGHGAIQIEMKGYTDLQAAFDFLEKQAVENAMIAEGWIPPEDHPKPKYKRIFAAFVASIASRSAAAARAALSAPPPAPRALARGEDAETRRLPAKPSVPPPSPPEAVKLKTDDKPPAAAPQLDDQEGPEVEELKLDDEVSADTCKDHAADSRKSGPPAASDDSASREGVAATG